MPKNKREILVKSANSFLLKNITFCGMMKKSVFSLSGEERFCRTRKTLFLFIYT